MSVEQAFNKTVAYYDDWMKKAVANYDLVAGTVQNIPGLPEKPDLNILDLGAGTGLFTLHFFRKYPDAHFVLVDMAEKLLKIAKQRFRDYRSQFSYELRDYRSLKDFGQYDLIISSLSIHHLEHREKRELFKTIFHLLHKGGIFINFDQIAGDTSEETRLYWDFYLAHINNSGAPREQIEESIARRQTYDKDATLSEQVQWLKDAGFCLVDCLYKYYFFGLFFARK